MNSFVLLAIGILALPVIGVAQKTAGSTACPVNEQTDDDVLLTICNHGHGMVPQPQPRLYLRIFTDGRGELESNEAPRPDDPYATEVLVVKTFHVDADEISEIRRLGGMPDFQCAKDVYPAYVIGTDSSAATTILFNYPGKSKKIIVNNFSYVNVNNRKNYGLSLCRLMALVDELRDRGFGIVREPPTISFCDLMRNRDMYLGKTVAMNATLEYSDTHQFIYDPECAEPGMGSLFTTEKLSVEFTPTKSQELLDKARSLRDQRFGGRARVYIYGTLFEGRVRFGDDTFNFRFAISKFVSIDPIILPYKGRLEPGWMYVDSFDATNEREPKLSSPLKISLHHAARVEWLNADTFPKLRAAGRTFVTFRVISRDIQKISNNRWNDIYICEILDLQ